MRIIIVDEKHGGSRAMALGGWARLTLSVCLLGLPVLLGYFGYQLAAARGLDIQDDKRVQAWAERLDRQQEEIRRAREEARLQLRTLTRRLAGLQARLLRLDALGERLTVEAGLEDGEFDFSADPALGGPLAGNEGEDLPLPDFLHSLEALQRRIEDRQQQLEVLEALLDAERNRQESFLTGWPVRKGWISSPYGERIDPFSGQLAWHTGIDFATGQGGVDVQAVATGVVTFAGERSGYGQVVELNHGNGYESLYAHNRQLLARPGDIVKKGQVIALSGSSGRSTGPHVHFEVHKHGRVVDPASYIRRTRH